MSYSKCSPTIDGYVELPSNIQQARVSFHQFPVGTVYTNYVKLFYHWSVYLPI